MEAIVEIDKEQLQQEATGALDYMKAFIVDTPEAYAQGAEWGREIARRVNRISEKFDPSVDKAYRAYKSIYDLRAGLLKPLEEAKKLLSGKLGAFRAEAERKRQEEQRRLEEEARKKAEAEARKAAEEAALQAAIEAEEAGDKKLAQLILEAPVVVTEPVIVAPVEVAKAVPEVQGVSGRVTWKAEGTDLAAYVTAVADGQAPIDGLKFNDTFLNQRARALRSEMRYPGVRVWAEEGTSFRTK